MLRHPENNKGGNCYYPWLKEQGEQCYADLGRTRPLLEALWSWRIQGLPGTHPACFLLLLICNGPPTPRGRPLLSDPKLTVKGAWGRCNPRGQPSEDRVVGEGQMKNSPHGDPWRGGKGLWWQRPGPGTQIEWGVSPSPQYLLLFLPITDWRAQLAGPPLPQALAVPVPIASCRLFLRLFLD